MRIKRFREMSVKRQYIIKFLIAVLLPVFAAEAAFFRVHLKTVKSDAVNLAYTCMEQAQDMLDNHLKQLTQIGLKLQGNSGFFASTLKEDAWRRTQIKAELLIYSIANRLGDNIQIYYQAFDGVYSTEGFTDLTVFLKNQHKLRDDEVERFKAALLLPRTPGFYKFHVAQGDALVYMIPLEYSGKASHTTLFFFIYSDKIRSIYDECMQNSIKGQIALFDTNDQLLFSTFDNLFSMRGEAYRRDQLDGVQLQDGKYTILTHVSPQTNWRSVCAIAEKDFANGIRHQQSVLTQIGVAVLLVGGILAVLLAYSSYRPIGKIYQQVGGQQYKKANEIDDIMTAVSVTQENNEQLQQIIERNTPLLVDRAMDRFLNGLYDADACLAQLETVNIDMRFSYFAVVAIAAARKAEISRISETHQYVVQFANDISTENASELSGIVLERDYENTILWILNTPNEWDVRDHTDELMKKLKSSGVDEIICMGVGRVYGRFADVVKSYADAMICIEQMRFKEEHGIVSYDDIIAEEKPGVTSEIAEKRLRFIQSIRQGNNKEAIEQLAEIEKRMGESYLLARYMLVDIVNAVVHLAYEVSGQQFEADLKRVLQIRGIPQAIQDLAGLTEKLCSCVAQQRMESSKQLGENMVKYVQEHFAQSDISLDSVAEYFGLSSYYVSRFFGQYTGVPFREYITRMRMEYAQKLLSQGDMPVRDIVQKIGYSDTSTFNKRFKKYVGVTPGSFRTGKNTDADSDANEE